MGHLTKLQSEYGKKGLNVIGITGEDRKTITQYMAHNDANFGYTVAIGGASGYPSPGIPYAALIGADGNVEYLGHPGSISNKVIEALLKKVAKLTPEEQEARAATMLASAEKLIADKQVLRAESILQKIDDKFGSTESGKQAAARAKEIASGDFKAEYDAQKELAKIVGGGIEKPKEADGKKMAKAVKVLDKKSAEWKEEAPKASELAEFWKSVAEESWQQAHSK